MITKQNWKDDKLGKNWWVRTFRRDTLLRLDIIENKLNDLIRSLGLVEPEPNEKELTIIEMIEELDRRFKNLENEMTVELDKINKILENRHNV